MKQLLPNGVALYNQKIGQGSPVLMLHGNSDSHENLADMGQAIARAGYEVYLIDSRGHGKSSHHDLPVRYNDFARDIDLFVEELGLDQVNIVGHSDGAIIATYLAMDQKSYLKSIVLLGLSLNPDDLTPFFKDWTAKEYAENPSPLIELMLNEPNISLDDLKQIKVPSFVVAAEDDVHTPDQYEAIATAIPQSELKILEGENHVSYVVETDKFAPDIINFLDRQQGK